MERSRRWRVVRTLQAPGQEPAAVVQFVLPWPLLRRFSDALDLAALVTGSEKLGAQLDALITEATTEWHQYRNRG